MGCADFGQEDNEGNVCRDSRIRVGIKGLEIELKCIEFINHRTVEH
jgi:hypothetical protein